jgi:hypothetical protein
MQRMPGKIFFTGGARRSAKVAERIFTPAVVVEGDGGLSLLLAAGDDGPAPLRRALVLAGFRVGDDVEIRRVSR